MTLMARLDQGWVVLRQQSGDRPAHYSLSVARAAVDERSGPFGQVCSSWSRLVPLTGFDALSTEGFASTRRYLPSPIDF